MKKFLMVLLAVAMLAVGGVMAFAATGDYPPFSENDVDVVRSFNWPEGSEPGDDPTSWPFYRNIKWKNIDGVRRIYSLDISAQGITGELNVSGLTMLEELYCNNNSITSLNMSDCTNLTVLHCINNQLTSLDVSDTYMIHLDCSYNKLSSLDLTSCKELKSLSCIFNELESIKFPNLSYLTTLSCDNNQLTSLNLSGCTTLTWLECSNNQLESLNLSGCTALPYLYCGWNNLHSLDLTTCSALEGLECPYNRMPNEDAVIGFNGSHYIFFPQQDGYGYEESTGGTDPDDTGDGDDNGGSSGNTGNTGSSGQSGQKYKVYRGGSEETFTQSLESYLQTPSTTYNPGLAHLLMSMSWAVKDETEIRKTFESFGFAPEDIRTGDVLEVYGMAKKQVGNQTLVLVVLRGTGNLFEGIDDVIGYVTDYTSQHSGFQMASAFLNLIGSDFLETTDYSNVKFVITGFSRGAAIANLLAARLIDVKGVNPRNLWAYTFACPDTIENAADLQTRYGNIFNISDARDFISWAPDSIWGFSNNWKEYGRSYWYFNNWSDYTSLKMTNIFNFTDVHGEDKYWRFLKDEPSLSAMKTRSQAKNALDYAASRRLQRDLQESVFGGLFTFLGIHCPVDLEVYAADGTLVATVIDNVPDILSEESLYIYVDGSEKNIFFLDNGEYTVKFIPTSDGYMDYTVQNVDIDTWTISGEKIYKTVAITKDQNLVSYVNVEDKTDTSAVRLYILNDDGEPGKEILPGDNSPSNNDATSKSTAKEEKDSNSYNYQAEQEALKAIKAANAGKSTSRVQTYPTAAGADVPAVTVKLYGWGAGLSLETMRTLAEGTTGLRVNLNNGAAYVLIPAGFTMPNIPGVLGYNLAYQKDPWQSSLMKALVKDPDANTETHLLGGGELPTAATVTLKTGLTGTVNVYHWDPTTRRVTFLAAGSAESGRVTFATKQLGNLILTDGTI